MDCPAESIRLGRKQVQLKWNFTRIIHVTVLGSTRFLIQAHSLPNLLSFCSPIVCASTIMPVMKPAISSSRSSLSLCINSFTFRHTLHINLSDNECILLLLVCFVLIYYEVLFIGNGFCLQSVVSL